MPLMISKNPHYNIPRISSPSGNSVTQGTKDQVTDILIIERQKLDISRQSSWCDSSASVGWILLFRNRSDHLTYQPAGLALEIFQKRHALHEGETWNGMWERVSSHVAMAEEGDAIPQFKDEFLDVLSENLFMPGGRICYGCGRPKGQCLNCFVAPTADSREGWGRSTSDLIVICGTGGGLGVNFSPVRPRGTDIKGTGGKSTGSVSLMVIKNAAGEVIKAGGGRRTALMFALSLTHGDIEEFLDAKLDLKQLNNANVSVIFDTDPEEFFAKVRADENYDLKFQSRVIGTIPAKKIWLKIIRNALKGGEPGLLNGYLANKMSNIWYAAPLICTNPCGEIWLEAYGCCCLGALVLPRFLDRELPGNGRYTINWKLLAQTVGTAVRFLDNVLTVNNYPLEDIKQNCNDFRRIGLGVMGLHDMLLMMGFKYGSDEGLEFVNKVMGFIKNAAYEASIELAKEKGPFPKFDADKFLKSGFAKTLKPSIRSAIRKYGIRNCALLTIAPTGTTSMECDVTSGIEPMFAPAYKRKFRDGEELKEEIVVHPLFRQFVQEGRDVSHFQGAHDLRIRDHFEMQRVCQRHLDNACSKTINLPPGTSEEELSDLYMEFFPELKGVTVYPDGSRENQPLTPLSIEEALAHIDSTDQGALSGDACRSGSCDI